ncbi:hypothetical protein [Agrococcus sp. SGAir0287]|uniref:hypothetical protein n=1 Tax=Agrococcus sp. SGAir0287 TaxID=2070347 RepID=UPI0010F9238F|nr:hypothetical protein [Agrococcus sp. SGAir0287]
MEPHEQRTLRTQHAPQLGFSRSYILSATDCGADGECLGSRMVELFWITGGGSNPLPAVATIVLGILLGLFGAIQFALMLGRVAILILLVGVLPLASSFTNTELGMQWMRRIVAWTLAFLLYKPVAALIFGTAMRMVGTDVFGGEGLPEQVTLAIRVVLGLIIFGLGVVALPALMRLMMPAVSPIVGGSAGMGLAVAGMAAIPAGASAITELTGKGGRSATVAPPGATPSPSSGQGPSGGLQSATRSSTTSTAAAGSGSAGAGAGAAAGAGVGAAVKGGAAIAGGAATAGTATAVLAAAEVASKVGKAGADGVQKMARGATGDEE